MNNDELINSFEIAFIILVFLLLLILFPCLVGGWSFVLFILFFLGCLFGSIAILTCIVYLFRKWFMGT